MVTTVTITQGGTEETHTGKWSTIDCREGKDWQTKWNGAHEQTKYRWVDGKGEQVKLDMAAQRSRNELRNSTVKMKA